MVLLQVSFPFDQFFSKMDLPIFDAGPYFPPMEILNCLAQQRGYKMIYPPQQHGIPMKTGAMVDK